MYITQRFQTRAVRSLSLGGAGASESKGPALDDKLLQLVVRENRAVDGGA